MNDRTEEKAREPIRNLAWRSPAEVADIYEAEMAQRDAEWVRAVLDCITWRDSAKKIFDRMGIKRYEVSRCRMGVSDAE